MKQYLLLTSALVASGLLNSGVANAACIKTPTCSSLGYESTTSCSGGLKCPFGNAWNCTLINKITEIEKQVTEIINNGGGSSTPDYSNCKVGDILYSDMTCNSNIVASKTPIGVVFDTTNYLAIAKDEFYNVWGPINQDISGITNYGSTSSAKMDWQGFNNTKAIYETDKTGGYYPAVKNVLTYSTEGTQQGQWYIPALGELIEMLRNIDTLNVTLEKINANVLSTNSYSSNIYWSSSEGTDGQAMCGNDNGGGAVHTTSFKKSSRFNVRPVINFMSKEKIDVTFTPQKVECGVAAILFSDKQCYLGTPDKIAPIGIVFDAENRKAIALETSKMAWSTERVDIPGLTNIEDATQAQQDFNGKENTATVIAYVRDSGKDLSEYPAFEYVYNYKTTGTNAGDWYLPALGEVNTIYSNKDFLNFALSLIGNYAILTNYLWSSSEISSNNAWSLYFGSGTVYNGYKNNDYYVRPVLAF